MAEVFESRCPYCGNLLKVKHDYEIQNDPALKVTCSRCKQKSVPCVDEHGFKILVNPEFGLPQTGEAFKQQNKPSTKQANSSSLKKNKLESFLLNKFHTVNTMLIGLWIAGIVGAAHSQLTPLNELLDLIAKFELSLPAIVATLIVIGIGSLLVALTIRDTENSDEGFQYRKWPALIVHAISFSVLILFLVFPYTPYKQAIDYGYKRAASADKAQVLFALKQSDCTQASEHYSDYQQNTTGEHPHLVYYIADICDKSGDNERVARYLNWYFDNAGKDDEHYAEALALANKLSEAR